MANIEAWELIRNEAAKYNAEIIAVSKKKPVEEIQALMNAGQQKFGENYVQELLQKHDKIPGAQWHFIGHLQTNKVRLITGFVSMIQSIDSIKLLREVDRQSKSAGRKIDCLIEVHIAEETTKTGFTIKEAEEMLNDSRMSELKEVNIRGLMGMATLTDDEKIIRSEFRKLRTLFDRFKTESFDTLSMGMTSDYKIALGEGSTMIRIGSAIFGERS